ncbi:hypothetical protein [Synechococcus sp. PCC 6312]|uniref:hypothetical protein n=1 Tax=Synechococcus sp. (strain ATCC 27167 / PCC 6312) TaxID=195253 RepID=UPI00029EDFBC|nr:hypothetical protein [Synechococcus sp. PCC 6312]AFY60584.1 hypothetical protein Syn6312_1413 [Synechococcus sp. PCC 6312]
MYPIRDFLVIAWYQARQRLPLCSLGLYLALMAMVAAVFTPIYIGRLSRAVPGVVIRSGDSLRNFEGIMEPGLEQQFEKIFLPISILFSALHQFWLPWIMALVFAAFITQYFVAQRSRINWFGLGAGSSGMAIVLMVLGLWVEPVLAVVIPIVGFPAGAAVVFLYRELECQRLAWRSCLAITTLATLFGLILGIWLLIGFLQFRAIGIPAGQSGHTLALVLFPYVCFLGLGLVIALLSPWFRRPSA